ncbi:MAG: class I SAM-dependent methyltransferase [Lachnospiraceae bacterium]|nr:class I SAM-dependent methyltransferase [Lachnospiraceae bacterium]
MGIMKKFFNQTRKPEGFLGNLMLRGMNSGHAKLADWGLSHLPKIPVSQAVDLGCGAGRNVGELLKLFPDAKVSGIDYSAASVQKTREYNKSAISAGRCEVKQGNAADLDLPAESFELATAFETIYFWPGLEKCFAQAAKVLKPGGYFLICNESDGTDSVSKKFESIIDGMKCYTADEIKAALKASGFSYAASYHHGSKPWITVLARK